MATFEEMEAHLANLRGAARNLIHAVIDDGCDCEMETPYDERGKHDKAETEARWKVYEDNKRNKLITPHFLFGWDVERAVVALWGTAYEIKEIPLERLTWSKVTPEQWKKQAWPHPSPLVDVAMGNEVHLAEKIDEIEPLLRAVVLDHVTRGIDEYRNFSDEGNTRALRDVLIGTSYSYGDG